MVDTGQAPGVEIYEALYRAQSTYESSLMRNSHQRVASEPLFNLVDTLC